MAADVKDVQTLGFIDPNDPFGLMTLGFLGGILAGGSAGVGSTCAINAVSFGSLGYLHSNGYIPSQAELGTLGYFCGIIAVATATAVAYIRYNPVDMNHRRFHSRYRYRI